MWGSLGKSKGPMLPPVIPRPSGPYRAEIAPIAALGAMPRGVPYDQVDERKAGQSAQRAFSCWLNRARPRTYS